MSINTNHDNNFAEAVAEYAMAQRNSSPAQVLEPSTIAELARQHLPNRTNADQQAITGRVVTCLTNYNGLNHVSDMADAAWYALQGRQPPSQQQLPPPPPSTFASSSSSLPPPPPQPLLPQPSLQQPPPSQPAQPPPSILASSLPSLSSTPLSLSSLFATITSLTSFSPLPPSTHQLHSSPTPSPMLPASFSSSSPFLSSSSFLSSSIPTPLSIQPQQQMSASQSQQAQQQLPQSSTLNGSSLSSAPISSSSMPPVHVQDVPIERAVAQYVLERRNVSQPLEPSRIRELVSQHEPNRTADLQAITNRVMTCLTNYNGFYNVYDIANAVYYLVRNLQPPPNLLANYPFTPDPIKTDRINIFAQGMGDVFGNLVRHNNVLSRLRDGFANLPRPPQLQNIRGVLCSVFKDNESIASLSQQVLQHYQTTGRFDADWIIGEIRNARNCYFSCRR